MKKAILFPYSKETRHFIEFGDLSSVEIYAYISPQIIGEKLPPIMSCRHFDSFDTAEITDDIQLLIVGYTRPLNELRKTDYLEKALSFALKHKMDLYAFDDIYCEKYKEYLEIAQLNNLHFYSPQISLCDLENKKRVKNFAKPRELPSIMILGTSANQGKFTMMMVLKRLFGSEAFYLGTEHHSMLFNIDVTFPYGVQAGVKIPIYEYKNYLALAKKNLDDSKKIIISCAQSGLLPLTLNDGVNRSYTLATIAFFLGINPTYIILVINPYYDEINFIKSTIEFINSTGNAKVRCLAFSDKRKGSNGATDYFSEKEICEIKHYYSMEFNLTCLSIRHDDWTFLKTTLI